MQDELGKGMSPDYCKQCQSEMQEVSRSMPAKLHNITSCVCAMLQYIIGEISRNVIESNVEQQKVTNLGLKTRVKTSLQQHLWT